MFSIEAQVNLGYNEKGKKLLLTSPRFSRDGA